MEKERAASQRERDQLRSDIEKSWTSRRRSEEAARAIDLYKRLKYRQGYKDHEQGKKPRYPLDDDVEMASKNAEVTTSGDEERSEEGEDTEEGEEDEEVRSVEGAPNSRVAQVEETSKAPSGAPPAQANVAAAVDARQALEAREISRRRSACRTVTLRPLKITRSL